MRDFSDKLEKLANGWLILGFFLLNILFMTIVLPSVQIKMAAGGGLPLDLFFFPSPEKTFNTLAAFTPSALLLYRTVETSLDVIYPISYSFCYSLLITIMLVRVAKKDSILRILNLLPFGALIFDLLENASIVSLIFSMPGRPVWLAFLLMIFNGTKWLFAGASVLVIIVSLATWLISRFRPGLPDENRGAES